MNIASNVGEARGPVPRAEAAGGRGRKRTTVRKPNWKAKFSRLGFMSAMVAILIYGWSLSASNHITAAEGVGYWLGIVGGSAMLLLLIYPLRKRYSWMRRLGSLPRWFQLHMMLGVIGPVLIIVHMGYRLGSPNSTVAFLAMITVATSGFWAGIFTARFISGSMAPRPRFAIWLPLRTMRSWRSRTMLIVLPRCASNSTIMSLSFCHVQNH